MLRRTQIVALLLLLTTASLLTACGEDTETVVVASKPMTEQFILAEMLTALIETHTDLEVEKNLGIGGGTSNIHPGMVSGEIDLYPEYTGTGWLFVLKEELIRDPDALYEAVKEGYQESYGIRWLDLYGFNDTYALAMKRERAEALGIATYSDLAAKSGELTLGAEYDFYEREDGYPGLQDEYGFSFDETAELDIGLKYQAIAEDRVDVINAFSTDAQLLEHGLVVLVDDANFFPSYHATTLVREETLEAHPGLEEVLNLLASQISDEEMIRLNHRVEVGKEDPQAVARDFLEEKGLL